MTVGPQRGDTIMRIAKRILAGCAAIAALLGPSANAATSTWTNTAGGSYDTAGNWSAAPVSTDDVVFSLNNTYTVNFPTTADRTNRTALINGGNVTFDLGGAGRNYTLAGIPSGFRDLVVGTNNATLTLTNGTLDIDDLTFGTGGLLGSAYTLGAGKTLVVDGTTTIATGGALTVNGGAFSSGSTTLAGGTLDVASLTNTGTFTFTSGTLDIDSLTFGAGGPLGSAYTLGAGKTLVVDGTTTLATGGSLSVSGGSFSSGSTTLNGGSLTADSLSGLGTIAFNAGTVNTGSLTFGAGGPLGSNYSLGSGRNLNVTNATTINAGSTLTINGGNFTTGSLVNNGTFQFLSGSMDLGSTPLTLGAGDSFNLGTGSSFVNTGTLSIAPGSTFVVNGGTFSAGSVSLNGGSFNFTSGQLNLTNSGLTIGAGGLLGNKVTLDANRQVSVSGNAVVQAGATLSVNGGTLGVGNILSISEGGTVNGQGTFNGTTLLVNGTLNLTGNADINNETVLIGDFFTPGGPAQISVADGTTTRFYGDVFANGTGITVGAGGEAIYYGYLGGGGTLGGAGTHTAGGTVSPGNSPGLLTVEGDFVFENSATFLVEINGLTPGTNPGYDVLDVTGDAWLDGLLDVDLLDGFAPNAGDSFDILLAEVLHGTFASTLFPTLGNNLRWELQYLVNPTGMDTVRLSAQVVPVPAAVWFFGSGLAALGLLRRRSVPAGATLH